MNSIAMPPEQAHKIACGEVVKTNVPYLITADPKTRRHPSSRGQRAPIGRQSYRVDPTFRPGPDLTANGSNGRACLPVPDADHLVISRRDKLTTVRCENKASDKSRMAAS